MAAPPPVPPFLDNSLGSIFKDRDVEVPIGVSKALLKDGLDDTGARVRMDLVDDMGRDEKAWT